MLITAVLGNLKNFDVGSRKIDFVEISPDDAYKKILRLTSKEGRDIGINLQDRHIHDGDVLFYDDDFVLVAEFLPQNLIEIMPLNLEQMGFVAHSLGNRHLNAHFENNSMFVEYDSLVEEFLQKENISFKNVVKKLTKPLKHAQHRH